MTNVNISLRKEAYDFLKKLKGRDMSFSEVVLSFKRDKGNIMKFFGALKDLDWYSKEKSMKELRSSFDKRVK